MSRLTTLLYVLVALINFAPIVGILSASRLESLYSISLADPQLIPLMRHRAALLGIVGGLLFFAAFSPPARPIALVAGFFSMLSYILLIALAETPNAALWRVMWIDVVAVVLLTTAWAID